MKKITLHHHHFHICTRAKW